MLTYPDVPAEEHVVRMRAYASECERIPEHAVRMLAHASVCERTPYAGVCWRMQVAHTPAYFRILTDAEEHAGVSVCERMREYS